MAKAKEEKKEVVAEAVPVEQTAVTQHLDRDPNDPRLVPPADKLPSTEDESQK